MQTENELKTNTKENITLEQENIKYPFQQISNKSTIPMIAGIILLIAGVFSIFFLYINKKIMPKILKIREGRKR